MYLYCILASIWLLRKGAEAGKDSRVVYRPDSFPSRCMMSHISTVSDISRLQCTMACRSKDGDHFQYNATARQCHLYSSQPSRDEPKEDVTVFTKEGTRDWLRFVRHQNGSVDLNDWILFVNRQDGSVDFDLPWADYRHGFGDLDGEFWLGLEVLHCLTSPQPYKFRAEMTDFDGLEYFAEYSSFQVDSESAAYRLSVSGYVSASTAGDSMLFHNGAGFSTLDVDNDREPLDPSCVQQWTGGWWYQACHNTHPTGIYYPQETLSHYGLRWKAVPGKSDTYSFKEMRMMIKPQN